MQPGKYYAAVPSRHSARCRATPLAHSEELIAFVSATKIGDPADFPGHAHMVQMRHESRDPSPFQSHRRRYLLLDEGIWGAKKRSAAKKGSQGCHGERSDKLQTCAQELNCREEASLQHSMPGGDRSQRLQMNDLGDQIGAIWGCPAGDGAITHRMTPCFFGWRALKVYNSEGDGPWTSSSLEA